MAFVPIPGLVGDTVFEIDTLATGVTVMDADAEVVSRPFGSGVDADCVSTAVFTIGVPPLDPSISANSTMEAESPSAKVPIFQVRVLPDAEAEVEAPSAVVGAEAGATSVTASLAAVPVAATLRVADPPPPATEAMVVPVTMSGPTT